MDIFSVLITKNLIEYLNDSDPFIQIECGIFNISFQKRSDRPLEWSKIDHLTKSFTFDRFVNITSYCHSLLDHAIMYEPLGLDVTISVDLMQIETLENIKFTNENVFWTTQKLVEKLGVKIDFPFKYRLVERSIDSLNLLDGFTLDDLKNILMCLFTDNARLIREQKRIANCEDIETKIIIDKTSNVLEGRHRVAVLHLLGIKRPIRCIEIDINTNKNLIKWEQDTNQDLLNDLNAYISTNDELSHTFPDMCVRIAPVLCATESNLEIIKQTILSNWIKKLPIV